MLQPSLQKNDKKAKQFIFVFSIVVFVVISLMGKYNLAGKVNLPFDEHVFAFLSAITNSIVAVLLVSAFIFVKRKNFGLLYRWHQMWFECRSYLCSHLLIQFE